LNGRFVRNITFDEAATPPSASMSVTVCSSVDLVRPAIVTTQPSAANAIADARPIPVPPPVMSAVFSANSSGMVFLILFASSGERRDRASDNQPCAQEWAREARPPLATGQSRR
jgi:hypothetical protein